MSFVREINIIGRNKLTSDQRKKSAELISKMHKEDSVLVKGIFKNLECPGGNTSFSYRAYKEEPIRTYTLEDGVEYEIPIGVAKHINRQCKYRRSAHLIDKEGKPIVGAGKAIQRYEFNSVDFR